MNEISSQLMTYALAYMAIVVVGIVMKVLKVSQTKLLFVSSLRMTVQLILAGFVLTWVFAHPHPLLTTLYFAAMLAFASHTVLSRHKGLNPRFARSVVISLFAWGTVTAVWFVTVIAGANVFDPRYAIPLGGMLVGNTMTGLSLALKSFLSSLEGERPRIRALLNLGVHPKDILFPIVKNAFETALLPTMNSMLGMGIVLLPGMMTGQILAGASPSTAVLYQAAIMCAVCVTVCAAVLTALTLGYRCGTKTCACTCRRPPVKGKPRNNRASRPLFCAGAERTPVGSALYFVGGVGRGPVGRSTPGRSVPEDHG